jgi:tetratricopeptide (TPR) repeat protein
LDLPGWQKLYDELKDEKFVLIGAAQDTGGEKAAGKFYDAANATFVQLVDENHRISSLFNLVNVPSAVWIDEEGMMVRSDEGTYAEVHKMGTIEFGTNDYVPAVRDWVAKGSESEYAKSADAVAPKLTPKSSDENLAESNFKLGVYFHQQGNEEKANQYWEAAQKLNPDSWNYARQDWSFTPREANANWSRKVGGLNGKDYYAPVDFMVETPE